MTHVFNGGGRAAAGSGKGKIGDCVTRLICIITGRPYEEVYTELSKINAAMPKTGGRKRGKVGSETAAHGIYTRSILFKRYMEAMGFVWTATMRIGTGCGAVHLRAGELPWVDHREGVLALRGRDRRRDPRHPADRPLGEPGAFTASGGRSPGGPGEQGLSGGLVGSGRRIRFNAWLARIRAIRAQHPRQIEGGGGGTGGRSGIARSWLGCPAPLSV